MFGAGFSNMLIEAPLIFIITREMQASYTGIDYVDHGHTLCGQPHLYAAMGELS